MNKKKIFNDPVYGFINIPYDLAFDLIEHPYFQRLRRIRQLGLTHMVYPGALHTRFHHALGAMHLMGQAIDVIRSKGNEISDSEAEASTLAILLHDIGHGPFSHALENSIVSGINHEIISEFFMERLNKDFNGRLSDAIDIFKNTYPKKFLHQLVSSQLDMDRLDYLNRDSFYTGVSEGVVGTDRIIKMLDVRNDELVVEVKGIYSIEKFIIARRLMYWQVYLHKTVIAAEQLLANILKRAKELADGGTELFCTPALHYFLYQHISPDDFAKDNSVLQTFAELDDYDIFASIKVWQTHPDKVLAMLCANITTRNLYRVELQQNPFSEEKIMEVKNAVMQCYGLDEHEVLYFVFTDKIANNAYNAENDKINILYKNGDILDITEASDQLNVSALAGVVIKHYLCSPKK